MGSPVALLNMRSIWSSHPVAKMLPALLKATDQTFAGCEMGRPMGCPVATCHSRASPPTIFRVRCSGSTSSTAPTVAAMPPSGVSNHGQWPWLYEAPQRGARHVSEGPLGACASSVCPAGLSNMGKPRWGSVCDFCLIEQCTMLSGRDLLFPDLPPRRFFVSPDCSHRFPQSAFPKAERISFPPDRRSLTGSHGQRPWV